MHMCNIICIIINSKYSINLKQSEELHSEEKKGRSSVIIFQPQKQEKKAKFSKKCMDNDWGNVSGHS